MVYIGGPLPTLCTFGIFLPKINVETWIAQCPLLLIKIDFIADFFRKLSSLQNYFKKYKLLYFTPILLSMRF
jgi:hypothetical protein